MSGWQPGDLAICVRTGVGAEHLKGRLFTVRAVECARGETGLRFTDYPDHQNGLPWWSAGFRKIHPLNEAERAAAMRDLNLPVPVEA